MAGRREDPSAKGAIGHSDADVLLHAVCDALLGAAALGDIGRHFPDKDPRWKNADSKKLLKRVVKLVRSAGWSVSNVDCTLVLEQPRIAPHVGKMRKTMAPLLGVASMRYRSRPRPTRAWVSPVAARGSARTPWR
jgi:2-C-methyl-D-erythritol 2,4-cyclodiphosphate synthase